MPKLLAVFLLAVIAACASASRLAANVIPPAGLPPGSQYQLIFATKDEGRDATSSNIADYNAFVTAEAALGVPFGLPSGLTWKAVGTTATVQASVNAPSSGLPVYNTRGILVAAASTGLYTATHLNPVQFDQTGQAAIQTGVWTGMSSPLGGASTNPLGQLTGFGPEFGFATLSDSRWSSANTGSATNPNLLFYALSTPITVVPEPHVIVMLGSAVLMMAGYRLFRRQRCVRLTASRICAVAP